MRPTLRTMALLALGGFAVHQARYALVPDPHGDRGHGYLHAVPAVLALLGALALGRTLMLVVRRAGATPAGASPAVRWLAASGALLALHVLQEGAERVLAGGGPLDAGALLAVPLCLAAGALVALALRGADELLAAASSSVAAVPRALLPAPARALPVLRRPELPRPRMLARHLAGRAPPALG